MVAIFLGVIGAAMGSFAGAVAWRLHAKRNFVSERSECESCHHVLSVSDLVPIVSWLALRGKCRYCGAAIGWTTFLSECLLAVLFVISYLYWPFGFVYWQATALFILWLGYLVALTILVIYDARWMLLPDVIVLPLILVALGDAALRVSLVPGANIVDFVQYIVYGALVLAGVYWLLYTISKGKWVGFGDIKLGLFMGIVLGWQKALLVLFLANMIGFLVVVPGLLSGRLTRSSRVPFGPFLIAAFVVAGFWGDVIIRSYLAFVGL